jgi:exonuclease III
MIKIISWNCKGLGSECKKKLVKDLVRVEKPQVLMLQETKMKDLEILQEIHLIWHSSSGIAASSRGASGGLYTLWNSQIFKVEFSHVTQHWILVRLIHLYSGHFFYLVNVYMPNLFRDKKHAGAL